MWYTFLGNTPSAQTKAAGLAVLQFHPPLNLHHRQRLQPCLRLSQFRLEVHQLRLLEELLQQGNYYTLTKHGAGPPEALCQRSRSTCLLTAHPGDVAISAWVQGEMGMKWQCITCQPGRGAGGQQLVQ